MVMFEFGVQSSLLKLGHPLENGAFKHLVIWHDYLSFLTAKRCEYVGGFLTVCTVQFEHLLPIKMFDYYEN